MAELRPLPGLEGLEGLAHGVSTRRGGVSPPPFDSLNVGASSGDEPANARANRMRVATALGFSRPPVLPHQVHGTRVVAVTDPAEPPGEADALVTDRPGVLLGVLGADCPGVALVAGRHGVLAVVHAGWRGVAGGIARAAVDHVRTHYGVAPAELRAAIGPGISAPRYEVTEEIGRAIGATLDGARREEREACTRPTRPGHVTVDLVAALRAQLALAGLDPRRVAALEACTYEDASTWFSHRRDGPRTGRHGVFAGYRAQA